MWAQPGSRLTLESGAEMLLAANIWWKGSPCVASATLRGQQRQPGPQPVAARGAIRWVPADAPTTNWPLTAPRIGGNPPASDADMVKLLTTGIWTTGKPLRFPMMPFRMNEADAKAVVAYLKSLTSQN